jgi:hypothetical protein
MSSVDDKAIDDAGKVLGATEKEIGVQVKKADKQTAALKRAYLTALAKSIIWARLENIVEEATAEDIEDSAEMLKQGSVGELARANPKAIIKDMARDAKDEAAEFMSDSNAVEDTVDIGATEMLKAINAVRI